MAPRSKHPENFDDFTELQEITLEEFLQRLALRHDVRITDLSENMEGMRWVHQHRSHISRVFGATFGGILVAAIGGLLHALWVGIKEMLK